MIQLIFGFGFLVIQTYSQTNHQISEKNAELESIRTEIAGLENSYREITSKQKQSLDAINNLNQQNLLLDKLIVKLTKEEKSKEKEIADINTKISLLNDNISRLKKNYANYIIWTYKNSFSSPLKYLIEAKSLTQAVIRYKYIRVITEANEMQLNNSGMIFRNLMILIYNCREKLMKVRV